MATITFAQEQTSLSVPDFHFFTTEQNLEDREFFEAEEQPFRRQESLGALMARARNRQPNGAGGHLTPRHGLRRPARRRRQQASAHQHRGNGLAIGCHFDAPEVWHPPRHDGELRIVVERPGAGYVHVVTPEDIRWRIEELPEEYREPVEVVQLSRMTRKRRLFPCYGLQWGSAVYLYPIEESLEERYVRPPRPAQRIETEMFGGRWVQDGTFWKLIWTRNAVRDFILNNVLIHEIGHINDQRNSSFRKRERFADWFAVEFGYRATGGRHGRCR